MGKPKHGIGVWSAARQAGISWERWASSNQACHKDQDFAPPSSSLPVGGLTCLRNSAMAHQINSRGCSWRGAKLPQQCLMLGQLHLWRTLTYALTSTEFYILPLLAGSRSKLWDQPLAGKKQHQSIHFVRAVLSPGIQLSSWQSVTNNHLLLRKILFYIVQASPNKTNTILLKEIPSVFK